MLVCLCNGLNEASLREAVRSCASGAVSDVYAALGCEVNCGTCISFAETIIADAGGAAALLPAE